jgi:hypothetical protein
LWRARRDPNAIVKTADDERDVEIRCAGLQDRFVGFESVEGDSKSRGCGGPYDDFESAAVV